LTALKPDANQARQNGVVRRLHELQGVSLFAAAVTLVLAYTLGCFNAGYYLLRWRDGRDLRQLGSGNAGARNAGRVLGRPAFVAVFLLDAAKGALAVLAAQTWAVEVAPLCSVVVVLGHVFPAQLGWRGGKGVAPALGALALLDVAVLAVMGGAFAVARLLLRQTVSAGLLAFAAGALFALGFRASAVALAVLALTLLLVYTHLGHKPRRDNAGANLPRP
jgi:glycerol-3-phosphate acyltransferase PlsY